MPVKNRFAELLPEITGWRRDFHEHPELQFDVHRTAGKVAELLKSFGCDEVVEGIGRTGVVGVIRGKTDTGGRVIGLRADMDALPINEATGLDYASKTPGKMHACGHDGHTAMLLGAAKYLAETRNFNGTAVVIFQPAEEGGLGGEAEPLPDLGEGEQAGGLGRCRRAASECRAHQGRRLRQSFVLTPQLLFQAANALDVKVATGRLFGSAAIIKTAEHQRTPLLKMGFMNPLAA